MIRRRRAASPSPAGSSVVRRPGRLSIDSGAMAYRFITDLPTDLAQRESDLASLAAAWKERRTELAGQAEIE
jgi:hypothetical protein